MTTFFTFRITRPILAVDGSIWLQSGEYPVVRRVGETKILIRNALMSGGTLSSELVLVAMYKGQLAAARS